MTTTQLSVAQTTGVNPEAFENALSFISAVRQGVSGQVVKKAVSLSGSRELFARILEVSPSNLSRYYRRKALSREDSEEVLDTLRALEKARQVWGSMEAARSWLDTPVPALNQAAPIELFDTFEGRKWVSGVLAQIEQGDFS